MGERQKHKNEEVVIDSHAAFNSWRKELHTFPVIGSLKFYRMNLPELSESENKNLSHLITAYHRECGCKTGSFFMSMAFSITTISYFISGGAIPTLHLQQIVWLVCITILAALGGKLFGLLHARWKLIRIADSVMLRVNTVSQINRYSLTTK